MCKSFKSGLAVCALLAFAPCVHAATELGSALLARPNLVRGESLYEECAACHQPDGSGQGHRGIPILAGQHYQSIVKELVDFRSTRRLDVRMEAAALRHDLQTAQSLADIAGFIAAMPVANSADIGSGNHVEAGRTAYARSCAGCHGAAGEGNGQKLFPRLAGQHYTYLLNQIDAMIGGYRFNVGPKHEQAIASLSDEEMTGVADYLARLKIPPNKSPD